MQCWPLVTCVLVVCAVQAAGCPVVCTCKWKGGKQTVECIDHALIQIPEGIDAETQVLDMSNNNLQILPRETFVRANLLNLQKVYLKSCRLGRIDNNAFRGLTNLVELDLSSNLLTNIPSATFQDIPFLREVVLSNNPIQKIESHAFQFIPGLVKLDLSGCELKTIAPKAFDELEQLQSLKLNDNRLSELRQKTVDALQKLQGVELHNNPWVCDCRLMPVKNWLEKKNIPYSVEPVCGSPERLRSRSFGELAVEDFACKPEVLPVSRHIEAAAGEDASVVCRVAAVPAATISWFWNGRLLQNNSAVATAQRVLIFEDGSNEKSSSLVLINAQETESADFYCVAENRAGTAEANFTLHVAVRQAGMASLGSGQIAGLSAALVVLILFILLLILLLLVRIRRLPFSTSAKSQTPHDAPAKSAAATVTIETERRNGSIMMSDPALKSPVICEIKLHNSAQKQLRGLTDVHSTVAVGHLNLNGQASIDSFRNPDLINEAERADGPRDDGVLAPRTLSGEYSRAHGDSLYPSGLWDGSSDLYLPDTTDKTPIIEDAPFPSVGGHPSPWDTTDYPADYGLPIPGHSPPPAPAPTNPPPTGAKTLRVWQRGTAPVLPPVTALKRVLGSRNSPDEGYQEGCGTDV
ncbi:leucine-rich repeat-containing protein 24 [Neocloeon triangulifer]|uniref:leucine-rich repeat-containing protein 24 n=1 Tax=Neocloeon triangulifer TaxID=2078957 RepID=UPI00286F2177|nr:leucine-rich repeat-containing protein 24 [Neocloeon triangulifer]